MADDAPNEKEQVELAYLNTLLKVHLTPALQHLEDQGVEVVVIGSFRGAQPLEGGQLAQVMGTVRTPLEAFALLVQGVMTMRPGVRVYVDDEALPDSSEGVEVT